MTGAPASPVDLWLIPTDQPAPVAARLWQLLDERERARTARADPLLRRRFTVVRGAVRQLVGARTGVRPSSLVWRYGPYGKPELAGEGGPQLSWSASGALAALALAEGRPVGVDVERLHDPRVAGRLAARHLPAAEARLVAEAPTPAERSARFTALWCRREACVKAHGARLVRSFGVSVAGASPLLLPDAGALGCGPLRLRDVPVPGAFRAALAAVGDAPVHVNYHQWQVS
ncbi:4'-phosphopantetheinyl transferase superfamily protein [Kitasatospora sp. NPDC097643]|uniref:4'-phosphopantetheinyl transferase family protein n=1 Tax=Kitasatospora sp. NPDC097643 TaxID=3157230 RepID=UPI00332F5CF7